MSDPKEPQTTKEPEDDFPDPGAEPIPGMISDELNPIHLKNPKLKDLIRSPDSPSRYLTWLSLAFGALALLCYLLLFNRYLDYRNRTRDVEAEKKEAERLYGGWLSKQNAFMKQKLNGEAPIITQTLGEFRVTWSGSELRADLVAECNLEETCTALKERPEQVHDLLLPVLQASSQESVLNPNKKLELRRELADKLNELKLKGKVLQVHFNDLTVEPAPSLEPGPKK